MSDPITRTTVETEGDCALREELACEVLGVTVVEPDPDWSTTAHDHAEEDHEEVYVVLEGAVTLSVDGESARLQAGEAVRIEPSASRRLHDPSEDATLVLASAPREHPEWNLDAMEG